MKHLYIATPTYDLSVSTGYATSLVMSVAACSRAGIVLSGPDFKHGPYIHSNRNILVHRFLQSTADTLLFVDADVGWDESALVRLYDSGYELCGGAYPKKEDKVVFPVKRLGVWREGWVETAFVPGGFMLIRREVFERMAPHVETTWNHSFGERIHCYFQNVIYHGDDEHVGEVGEDIEFCNRWRVLGGTVWCYSNMDFEHSGTKVWVGNYGKTAIDDSQVLILPRGREAA